MTREIPLNDPIAVTATMDKQGFITPQNLIRQGKHHTVTGVGRQWESDEGRHILVETAGSDRFEILLSRADLRWYLRRAWLQEITV